MARFIGVLLSIWATIVTASVLPRQQNDLRIVPLGDSITFGWWSSDLNGYRQDLALMLQHVGYSVEYIGFQQSGQMINNRSEGYPGATIAQIQSDGFEVFNGTYPSPNVILLHAGTNDALNAYHAANQAGASVDVHTVANQMINDLATLLNGIYAHAPNTLVVLAQIILDAEPQVAAIESQFNEYIPFLIKQYGGPNSKIIGVNMGNIDVTGPDHDSVFTDDPTHPGNFGFQKMASNFFIGITAADQMNLISAPDGAINPGPQITVGPSLTNPSSSYAEECDYYPTWPGSSSNLFTGPSLNTGSAPNWATPSAQQSTGTGQSLGSSYTYLVDINHDGLADYLIVDSTYGSVQAWYNQGPGAAWKSAGYITTGSQDFEGATIKFADMNADGYVDLIVHNSTGVFLFYNYYGNGFILEQLIASGYGGDVDNTYFADINGDGRADLIWVDESGNIRSWLNIGIGTNTTITWNMNAPAIASGATGGLSDRFIDVDGDGRADWVHIASDSSMTVALNPDLVGYGAAPSFMTAFNWAPAYASNPAQIILGDVQGLGLADIGIVDMSTSGLSTTFNPGMSTYGQIRFADANDDGLADAFLIDNEGNVQAWQNTGNGFSAKNQVFTTTSAGLGPRYIRFADLNADGNTDLIVLQRTSFGTVDIIVHPGQGNFVFGSPVTVWSGGLPQGCGDASQIHFTDNNGDGRDDLICVTPDATAWLTYNYNTNVQSLVDINWQYFGWILIDQGVGLDQARFADLNGDGQGDVMTLDTAGGIHAFISNTPSAIFGGINAFPDVGVSYSQVILADVNGDSRADYIVVDTHSGAASVYINQCQDNGFPRKPYLPRPDSPGTSLSTGSNAPTLTVEQSSGGSPSMTSSSPPSQTTPSDPYCTVFADPDRGVSGYCSCSDHVSYNIATTTPQCPQTSPGPATGLYSPTPTPPTPCSSTMSNGAVIVYASNTTTDNGVLCTGASTTLWVGKTLTAEVESSASIEVNPVTGSALFSSVSSALSVACPLPTSGSTVSSCGAVPTITGIRTYDSSADMVRYDNAVLTVNVTFASYYEADALNGLISLAANILELASLQSQNNGQVKHNVQEGRGTALVPFNVTYIPANVQTFYEHQDLSTRGQLLTQNLGIQLLAESNDAGSYVCSSEALGADLLAGASPFIEQLGPFAVLAPFISFSCLILDSTEKEKEQKSNTVAQFGPPTNPIQSAQVTPSFAGYSYTLTGANNEKVAYPSPTNLDQHGNPPTAAPAIVVQAGTSISMQYDSTSSVAIGTLYSSTPGGPGIYTSISNILTAACPSPTGRTVTQCAAPAAITDVVYFSPQGGFKGEDNSFVSTDGELEVTIPLVSYSTTAGWLALINGISALYNTSALQNVGSRHGDECCQADGEHCGNQYCPSGYTSPIDINLAYTGSIMQVIVEAQDDTTNGEIRIENMQVQLTFETPEQSEFLCSAGAFAADIVSLLAFIPGLEFLAFLGPGFAIACETLGLEGGG